MKQWTRGLTLGSSLIKVRSIFLILFFDMTVSTDLCNLIRNVFRIVLLKNWYIPLKQEMISGNF